MEAPKLFVFKVPYVRVVEDKYEYGTMERIDAPGAKAIYKPKGVSEELEQALKKNRMSPMPPSKRISHAVETARKSIASSITCA